MIDRRRGFARRYALQPAVLIFPSVVLLSALLFVSAADGDQTAGDSSVAPLGSSPSRLRNVDFITVPENQPWLVAVACPLASRLRHDGRVPLLIAVGTPPTKEAEDLLDRVAPQGCLMLLSGPDPGPPASLMKPSTEVVVAGPSPIQGSLLLAKRFWGKSRDIVVAALDDPEAAILGSTLASHLSIPVLLHEKLEDGTSLSAALDELQVEEVFLATAEAAEKPPWTTKLAQRITVMDSQAIQHRVIAKLEPRQVHNIVLTSIPAGEGGVGGTAWLAPYLSLARGAPVVLSRSMNAADAEARVNALINECQLRPRTVTILADYQSIGRNCVKIPAATGRNETAGGPLEEYEKHGEPPGRREQPPGMQYEVATEPCMPTSCEQLATVGVGRIPFKSPADASVLFARGLARERALTGKPARMLLVANPNKDSLPLPLCEVISRVTAKEFKNARVHVDEFYGKRSNSPEIIAATSSAHLIIYQGHLYDQYLFSAPAYNEGAPDYEYDEGREYEYDEDPQYEHDEDPQHYEKHPEYYEKNPDYYQQAQGYPDSCLDDGMTRASAGGSQFGAAVLPVPRPVGTPSTLPANQPGTPATRRLDGLPVVILQSCDSLEDKFLRRIHELEGVALVASATHVHSGSGSAFVKAVGDGVLYRGGTLGEAIRDARNYFFCLQDLKNCRGHCQQAKGQRVALGFQLWGDPELQVFPQGVKKPRFALVSTQWAAADRLTVVVPPRRLLKLETDKYVVRMFPGSQAAGMVKRLKNKPLRRVTPIYFFRLPLPEGFAAAAYAALDRPQDKPNRAVFRVDPMERFLHVLYYPDKEKPNETFTLQFRN